MKKKIVILGAGPAGLTVAYELSKYPEFEIEIFEKKNYVGGISATISENENSFDIGGHRFFTKSEKVLKWWQEILPIYSIDKDIEITYKGERNWVVIYNSTNNIEEDCFLIRPRKSRIFFNGKFYDYPIKININTLTNLGLLNSFLFLTSYFKSKFLKREEKSLEDFLINRFGFRLYKTFFKSYTEKVWGKKCHEISKDWGEQRIKGLSLSKVLMNFIIKPKEKETSLIEYFLYPKKGPGMLWEKVRDECLTNHVNFNFNEKIDKIDIEQDNIIIKSFNKRTTCDILVNTIALKDFFSLLDKKTINEKAINISSKLEYRGLIVVCFELNGKVEFSDNWLYIQEENFKVGRIQFFDNWSRYMVKNQSHSLIGMEFFVNEDDVFWTMPDQDIIDFAIKEWKKLNLSNYTCFNASIIKTSKAYPSYVGNYDEVSELMHFFEKRKNVYTIGRNGLHRYNNQDHSMLTAFELVQIIVNKLDSQLSIWKINSEEIYHETN